MKQIFRVIFILFFVMTSWTGHIAPAKAMAFPDYLSIWFPQWFGPPDDPADPSKTLQAPFADPKATPKDPGAQIGVPYVGFDDQKQTDLSKPHRTHQQIAEWLTRAVAEVMSISANPQILQAHLARLNSGMSPYAVQSFKNFLDSSGVVDNLRKSGTKLNSVVDGAPLLLNEGVVEGRYRWLFQVPVTMTFVPEGVMSPGDYSGKDMLHQNMTLLIQVGHVKGSVQGSLIETWQIKKISALEDPDGKEKQYR